MQEGNTRIKINKFPYHPQFFVCFFILELNFLIQEGCGWNQKNPNCLFLVRIHVALPQKQEFTIITCKNEIKLCKNEIKLCKNEIKLCKNEIKLCKNEIKLCKNEIKLCKNEIKLYLPVTINNNAPVVGHICLRQGHL